MGVRKAGKELECFYPRVGCETPVAYIWRRTIRCPNPSCGVEVPLTTQWWLAKRGRRRVALKPILRGNREVGFELVGDKEIDFEPSLGTVKRGRAVCLACNTSMRGDYVKAEAREGRIGQRLVAVARKVDKRRGRSYRLAGEEDIAGFQKAEMALKELLRTPSPWAFGLSWVPQEPSRLVGAGRQQSVEASYGFLEWGKFFNSRQLMALCTFGKWVREAYKEIVNQTGDYEFAKAVTTYLGFAVDKMADLLSVLTGWKPNAECPVHLFAHHAIPMLWDYAEANPLAGASASWASQVERMLSALTLCFVNNRRTATTHLGSANRLFFEGGKFDAVVIDPPYADSVPYSDLSDFFYVWLRRIIGDLYPEAFSTELVPKDEEAVVNAVRFGGKKHGEQIAKAHYQRLMRESFAEIYRVLNSEGVCIVMFSHRSTSAWERLVKSLLDAGLYPTASFPVHTEMEASTHQRGKAAVRSTVVMACRRRSENAGIGWYREVMSELRQVVCERLREFWREGIRGADFLISAIGPAVGIFGKYREVRHLDGTEVKVAEVLQEVRKAVVEFTLQQLGFEALDEPTRFYIFYRWAYGSKEIEYDEANKLAKGLGVELSEMERRYGLINRDGDEVRVLSFEERKGILEQGWKVKRGNERYGVGERSCVIDQIQISLLLWEYGQRSEVLNYLASLGVKEEGHSFWRVAQAIMEVEGGVVGVDGRVSRIEKEVRVLAQLLGSKQGLIREMRAKVVG